MNVTYEKGEIINLVGVKKWLLPTEMRNLAIWEVRKIEYYLPKWKISKSGR